jgi:hypothetical protein
MMKPSAQELPEPGSIMETVSNRRLAHAAAYWAVATIALAVILLVLDGAIANIALITRVRDTEWARGLPH